MVDIDAAKKSLRQSEDVHFIRVEKVGWTVVAQVSSVDVFETKYGPVPMLGLQHVTTSDDKVLAAQVKANDRLGGDDVSYAILGIGAVLKNRLTGVKRGTWIMVELEGTQTSMEHGTDYPMYSVGYSGDGERWSTYLPAQVTDPDHEEEPF